MSRFLPRRLAVSFGHRPYLRRMATNFGWLFSDQVIRMGLGLFVGAWVARYLGPEQFGLLSFATAIVAIFGAVATLGLPEIVVRDLARDPSHAPEILGSSFVLRLIGGAFALALAIGAAAYARPDHLTAKIMVAIIGSGTILRSAEVVRYWFQSQLQAKYAVWVENSALIISSAVKIIMILEHAPLIAFAWALLIEAALAATGLFLAYMSQGRQLTSWRPTLTRASSLVHQSWPLVLSGIAIMMQARIDQVMLGAMIGDGEVGQYSAAMRLIEAFAFVPSIISLTFAPSIAQARSSDARAYANRLTDLYRLMIWAFLLTAIPIVLLGKWIVLLVFGPAYDRAAMLLPLFAIRLFFANFGVAKTQFITNESLFKYSLMTAVIGSLINIGLNYLLIPSYRSEGALIATIASFAVTIFLIDIFFQKTRVNLGFMAKALLSPHRIGKTKN